MHIFASRSREQKVDLVAQLVEQYTFNVWALGSSPNGITQKDHRNVILFLWYQAINASPAWYSRYS